MMGTTLSYRCSRCEQAFPWEELNPQAGVFDLLCSECLAVVRAELEASPPA